MIIVFVLGTSLTCIKYMGVRLLRRMILICVIVMLAGIVAIGGNLRMVNSDSVLKQHAFSSFEKNNFRIFINLTENKLYLISDNKTVKTYGISAGKTTTPSPIGSWKIVTKNKWQKGFGGYFMGLNVPWGKYGIHGTTKPWGIGSAVSMGCVRMLNKDVEELYGLVAMDTPVRIYGGPYGPFGEGFRVIYSGDRGADVYEIEKKLKEQGYLKGKVNGVYDAVMVNAVHDFEKEKGIKPSDTLNYEFYKKLGIVLME